MSERIYRPGTPHPKESPPLSAEPHSGHPRDENGQSGREPCPKAFPAHCLPPAIAAMTQAIANAQRTPIALAAVCTIGVLSASIGRNLQIQSGPNQLTRANVMLLASAESGSGKSENFRHAMAPVREFEKVTLKAWQETKKPRFESERDVLAADLKALQKKSGNGTDAAEREQLRADMQKTRAALAKVEAQLCAPALTVEDVTSEKLAAMLAMNGETLASFSADAGAIVNNLLGRYSKLDRPDEVIYLKAFSGDFCRVDRQKNVEPILLESPCLTTLWLVQPDKIKTLLSQSLLVEGGLMPRLLVCHTHAEPLEIVPGAPGIPPEVSQAYRELIHALLASYRCGELTHTFAPDPVALAMMVEHYNRIVGRRRYDLRDVGIFAARWNEQAWRLAVCLHAGKWGGEAHEHPLDTETAAAAIELADWFADQQLEILSAGRESAQHKLREKVLALCIDKPSGIRPADLYRHHVVPNAETARELLLAMERDGQITGRDEKPQGGPPQGGGHVPRIYTKVRR